MERTDIAFRDVTFGYGEMKMEKHLSLRMEAGKT
jgi:ABC-type multidrug transport system fused ATPase/permease subunit